MQKKVQLPAIALLVLAGVAALMTLAGHFMNDAVMQMAEQSNMPEEQLQQLREAWGASAEGFGALNMLGLVLNVVGLAVIVLGALRMKQLRSYGLAITASILAMIPCFTSCCCILGIPIGIWSLIVLFDKDVKAAFQTPAAPPPL